MKTDITISDGIEVFEWRRGDWFIFASTEHEDGRYLGFTKGFGSKANTMKVARQWAKMTVAQLRDICHSI